nr:patatin-like phospholipase family protein [Pseudothauera nasutitermitis]
MKGGITSGVIYPKLIARLATRYEFKNIGGTSAGAIAAGACAAAEYGRHNGHPQAFDELAKLPEQLSEPTTPDGRSKLFSLFQPADALRPHFAVLVRALNTQPPDAVLAVLIGLAGMYKGLLGIGLVLGSLLCWPFVAAFSPATGSWQTSVLALCMMLLVAGFVVAGFNRVLHGRPWQTVLLAATLVVLITLLLAGATGQAVRWHQPALALGMVVVGLLFLTLLLTLASVLFARDLLAGLHGNFYGLCSGQTPTQTSEATQQGLTDWLTAYFDGLAGLSPEDGPLTFAHLWGHDGNDPTCKRAINLEVMTSAISQQMVYGIPFRPGTPPFYYDPEEWARLFPKSVMDHLASLRQRDAGSDGGETASLQVESPTGKPLFPLPRDGALPVVVAIRMSLSFPVLLSAVPLHAIDWSLKESKIRRQQRLPIPAKRVWFSDGGIGSNMPLHMFDALLPGHPTFAVNLKPEHVDHPIATPEQPDNNGGRIYLPNDNRGGRQRYWPDPEDKTPLGGLIGFVGSIVNTMQNWRDEIMFPYPGFRDRIIQISQRTDEGGLNLDMPEASITALGNAGEMAADRLIDRFHPEGGQQGLGWDKHLEARLATFLGTMQPGSAALAPVLDATIWRVIVEERLPRYSKARRKLATDFLEGVQALGKLGQPRGISLDKDAPRPLAQVRIAPRI